MTQRELIVSIAQGYIGLKESDGSHKLIIDIYNNHKPLAQGYKVSYNDPWCSTFASAVAIKASLTNIIPTECGCERHVNLFKSHSKSRWEEDGTYIPSPGDYCFYNWDDSTQPNDGAADHVGIVEKVVGKTIYIIEGNYSNAVGRRPLTVGAGNIRGYGIPAYAEDEVDITKLILEEGDGGAAVKELQQMLIKLGYSCGPAGADGDFGSATKSAVMTFQRKQGLTADGIVGSKTWAALKNPLPVTPSSTTVSPEEPTVIGNSKMKYNSKNKPLVCIMDDSTCYKGTSKMTVKGVLWHSTGANNPNLKRYVQPSLDDPAFKDLKAKLGDNANDNSWNEIYVEAGVNAFIGKLANGSITSVQTLPWDFKPWGCGKGSKGSCNNGWIQFEICEDGLTNESYFNKVYEEACHLTAYLCSMYDIDPTGFVNLNGVKVPTILCHADSHDLGLGSNHIDVRHWFKKYGKTMDNVRSDVNTLMKNGSETTTTVTATPTKTPLYRVRAKWEDASTQKGAFGKLESAIACCDRVGEGYFVFDPDGKVVYPEVKEEVPETKEETKSGLQIGDEISLVEGAVYTSGKAIPNWIFRTKLYVRGIQSNGNIIFSTLKTGATTGIVEQKYIKGYEEVIIETALKKGDEVKLLPDATYVTGKAIPEYIFNRKLYLRDKHSNGNCIISTLASGAITGVVNEKYLTRYDGSTANAEYTVKVNVNTLNVRQNPGTSYPVVAQIKKGTSHIISETEGKWGYIKNLNGWIYLAYTKKV